MQHIGVSREIPLNIKPRENTGRKWRETFHENQNGGEPLRRVRPSHFKLTSCAGSYHVLSCSSPESVQTDPHTHTHTWLHLGQTPLSCRERPALPCLVCYSAPSKCDKTHEGMKSNEVDSRCRDRFTALLLQAYIQWIIYTTLCHCDICWVDLGLEWAWL